MAQISIIIAIYNSDKFLSKCIDSIKLQTFTDYEVLLVDDGSTDKSSSICKLYAETDTRFKYFHKQNGGVASAREYGLLHATGKYIIHVDSDDWIEPKMLKTLYDEAERTQVDMLICDYYYDTALSSCVCKQEPGSLDNKSIINELLNGTLHGSCWNKLVKKETLIRHDLHFPNCDICEDLYINISLLLKEVKVGYINKAFYHYVQRDNGNNITGSQNTKAGLNALHAAKSFRILLGNTSFWRLFVEKEMPWMAYATLYHGAAMNGREFAQCFGDLRQVRDISIELRIALRWYGLGRMLVLGKKIVGKWR
jgi:glycosyltransferase involved in cell wall biosynthesis